MVTKATKAAYPLWNFVTVPLHDDLFAAAKLLADKDERSLSSFIRLAIKDYVKRQGVSLEE